MKALSIRQPWAELILKGRKTLELRTWQTTYRGLLLLHAGQRVRPEACRAYGLDPAGLVRGALIGTAELVEIVALDEAAWESLREQHLSLRDFTGPTFGWRLTNPQRLSPVIPLDGRLGLFDVPDEVVAGSLPGPPTSLISQPPILERDPQRPFALRVVSGAGPDYGLVLYQWPVASNGGVTVPQQLALLNGDGLRVVADHVLDALRRNGYKATELSRERREPIYLDEETGVHLGLLFLAVRPLTRLDRIEAISVAVRTMPSEEAYYWFSKCTATLGATNALRALRILLAGE